MECRICYETVTEDNLEILECTHSLCQSCLGNLRHRICPFCRTPIGGPALPPPRDETLQPLLLHLDISLDIVVQPRRRRRRRPRRRSSPRLQVRAPQQLDPDDIDDLLNGVARPAEVESKNEVSVSDRKRQRRRNSRNRWREQNVHNNPSVLAN